MLVKFEAKSPRVKGLSFHPIRPWIISSLHNGEIQIWDYRLGVMIDKYEGHDGPVRGIDFHKTQPLFVSGGDDNLIKVWNYKQKKALFSLKGHIDYIRTVQFHSELPWILSSSDDQTVRLWNWQNRGPLAILTGHSHYVMCAQFHPTKDLIVSCSLDLSLRLWDFSPIRKKFISSGAGKTGKHELYGNEVEIKAVMEGHERGVNWCSFHPTLNLICSAADDRKVKIWKYSDSNCWEHDSLYGHQSNVSSCCFHPKIDAILTNSEDKTTRVWSLERRNEIEKYKSESERYWVITSHPENYLFASGSDNGFQVFSLFKEKVPHQILQNNNLLFALRNQLRLFNFNQNSEVQVKTFDSQATAYNVFLNNVQELTYNHFDPSRVQLLVTINESAEAGKKVYLIVYDSNDLKTGKEKTKIFSSAQACFVSKNKVAVFKEAKEIEIYNLDLDQSSGTQSLNQCEKFFQGPVGKLLCVSEDQQLVLYDVNMKKIVAQTAFTNDMSNIKRVVWNKSTSFVALICKRHIHILTKTLNKVCQFTERFNIKSVIWKDDLLVFSTLNHIKYGLLNGEQGIIKCTDSKVRVISLEKNDLITIDAAGKIISAKVDCEELQLKQALFDKNYEKTQQYLQNSKRLGNSTVSYLYKKNYCALAMNLVTDQKAKFSLAIDSGNLEVAYKTCTELKDKELFKRLAEEALRQGNHQLLDVALQQTRNYEKLSFLYLVLGKQDKLEKMLQIAQNRGDNMSRFHNALFLGDVSERIKILAEVSYLPLAYMTAVAHGYTELAEPLLESVENPESLLRELEQFKCEALVPPLPLIKNLDSSPQAKRNWPHNYIPEENALIISKDQDKVDEIREKKNEDQVIVEDGSGNNGNGRQEQFYEVNEKTNFKEVEAGEGDEPQWPIDDEDDIMVEVQAEVGVQQQTQTSSDNNNNNPLNAQQFRKGENVVIKQAQINQHIADQCAIGYFENAFALLKKQLGIYNFELVKSQAVQVFSSAQTILSGIPFLRNQSVYIQNNGTSNRPYIQTTMSLLTNDLKQGYKFTNEGKFQEGVDKFRQILATIPFIVLQSGEDKEIEFLIRVCVEYIVALSCEIVKRNVPAQELELTAYMALCNIQPQHRVLCLRSAMTLHWKKNNFIYASWFAKKLLRIFEANPNLAQPKVLQNAQNVFSASEKKGTNETKINLEEQWLYDDDWVISVDSSDYSIIKGAKIKCPYCSARYDPQRDGSICWVCKMGKIGAEILGLKK